MRREFGTIREMRRGELYRVFWQENGKKRSHHVRGTRADASKYLAMVQSGVSGIAKDSITFAEYWEAVVLPSCANLSEKTVSEYVRLWEREMAPKIGARQVAKTKPQAVQALIDGIEAPCVQRKVKMLMHKICRMAVERDGILDRNPVTRDIVLREHVRREKTLVTVDGVAGFMEAIRGLKIEPVLLFELGGGLSPEEACALTWEDVSFDDGYCFANVSKTLVTVNGRKLLQYKAKNRFRIRECVIGKPFSVRLEELAATGPICKGAAYRAGTELSEESFASPVTLTHNWRAWCERHGMAYVSQENMRSSFATMHGEAGSPDSLVSMAMGHSDGTTRGRNYQQSTRRGMMLIADMLADVIGDSTL